MDIVDWLDDDNSKHARAWIHLHNSGVWPDGFIPEDITFQPSWEVLLAHRMAKRWTENVIENSSDTV